MNVMKVHEISDSGSDTAHICLCVHMCQIKLDKNLNVSESLKQFRVMGLHVSTDWAQNSFSYMDIKSNNNLLVFYWVMIKVGVAWLAHSH